MYTLLGGVVALTDGVHTLHISGTRDVYSIQWWSTSSCGVVDTYLLPTRIHLPCYTVAAMSTSARIA